MQDWAVVLIAAFGGGLAGAVLQPLASHVLQRMRSTDDIRKRRERSLRRMVLAQMAWTRKMRRAATMMPLQEKMGRPMTPEQAAAAIMPDTEGPLWQPTRIADPSLQQMAYEVDIVSYKLYLVLTSEYERKSLSRLSQRIKDLEEGIIHWMDELNWPEVDE